ncbi:MAG: Gfa-like protein [uncultured Rubellimicrobium sp.]|uniref:Gfa-like protein n=1 Tax=uncultured Rubellimicrobium sp. TaxID=543078 RepID=A0A6J4Q965_9RHOB|nr:MAG: Gfa-like protein [uncultured Rubellimicrobium sp.]
MDQRTLTGGCQCGAVRFVLDAPPDNVHVCHCRMCQKAVGGPFAVICPVAKSAFHVARGEIAWFASSDVARRGFCRDCGTPLIFDYPHDPGIGVMAGSFDRPDLVPPVVQYGVESRVPWYGHLPDLPGDQPTYSEDPDGMLPRIQASNHQHPDHDTDVWPPKA